MEPEATTVEQLPDTQESLNREYSIQAAKAGDLQYMIKCFQGDLEAVNQQMLKINQRVHELKTKAEQA